MNVQIFASVQKSANVQIVAWVRIFVSTPKRAIVAVRIMSHFIDVEFAATVHVKLGSDPMEDVFTTRRVFAAKDLVSV